MHNYAEIMFCKIRQTCQASLYSLGEFQNKGILTWKSLGEHLLFGWVSSQGLIDFEVTRRSFTHWASFMSGTHWLWGRWVSIYLLGDLIEIVSFGAPMIHSLGERFVIRRAICRWSKMCSLSQWIKTWIELA